MIRYRSFTARFWSTLLPVVLLIAVAIAMAATIVNYLMRMLHREDARSLALIDESTHLLAEIQQVEDAVVAVLREPTEPSRREALHTALANLGTLFQELEGEEWVREAPLLREGMRDLIFLGEALVHAGQIERDIPPISLLPRSVMSAVSRAMERNRELIEEDLRRAQRKGWWFFFFIGVVFLLVLVSLFVAGRSLALRLVRPIDQFIQAAQDVGGGNLQARPAYEGRDEFRRLSLAFDSMVEALRSDRIQLNADLLHTRVRMEALIENLPSPVMFFDEMLRIEALNREAGKLFPARPRRDDLPEAILRLLEEVRDTGEAHVPESLAETVLWPGEGGERVFLPRVFRPERRATGGGVALVLIDVSRLRLSEELQHDLLRVVHHELKTPLTSSRLALHMLHDDSFGDLSPIQRELVETAQMETERLLRMITNLLDLGSLHPAQLVLHCEELHLDSLLEAVVEDLQDEAEVIGVPLRRVPPEAPHPPVRGDRSRLQAALGCLLGVVLKHVEPDSTIELSTGATEEHILLRIEVLGDKNPPRERHRKLIRRLRKAASSDSLEGDLELGMAAKVARAHRGDIWAGEVEAQKVEFHLRIPFAPSA
jgi:two-component system, NtrC family, sensor histidine kinase KinB